MGGTGPDLQVALRNGNLWSRTPERRTGNTWAHVVWLPSTADMHPARLDSAPGSLRLCAVCFCLLIYSLLLGLGLPAATLHVCQELDTRGDTERTKARSLPLSTKRALSPHQGPVGVVCWFSAWPCLLARNPSQPCYLAGVCLGLGNRQQTHL